MTPPFLTPLGIGYGEQKGSSPHTSMYTCLRTITI
jgi:hypothetical protein